MQTAYISHPLSLKHDMGTHHPECPARIHAIEDRLIAAGLLDYLQRHDAPAATREQLLRVHDADYVDSIEASVPQHGIVYLDGDTAMNPFSYQAALHAAGAVVLGVDLVMARQVENAFCNIRPPVTMPNGRVPWGFAFSIMSRSVRHTHWRSTVCSASR